jgi:hypothetical protein
LSFSCCFVSRDGGKVDDVVDVVDDEASLDVEFTFKERRREGG